MKKGWKYVELSNLCKVQNGYAFNSKLFNEDGTGTPLIRIRDIKRGYSMTYTDEECTEDFFVKNGDLLIGMDGDFNVGEWRGKHALLNQRVCKIIPSDKVLSRFIFYCIPSLLQEINKKTAFSTVKHLSSKQVNKIEIPEISLTEQQRIVSYLDTSFAKIDALAKQAEESLENAKALFQATLKELMEKKEGWEEKRMDEISQNLDYKRKPVTKGKRESGIYPYYGASGIVDYVKDYIYDEDILLVSEDGANLLARSTPIAFSVCGKVWVNNHAHVLKFENINTQKYIEYYFASIDISEYVTGAAQPKFNQARLNSMVVALPSIAEQQSIVATLDTLSEKVSQLQQNYTQTLANCQALKQALLRETFE